MGHLFNEEVLWKEYCLTTFHYSCWEERKFSNKLIVNFVLCISRLNLEKADANPLKNLHLNFVKQKGEHGKGVSLVVHGGYLIDLRWGHRRTVEKARVGQWGEMIRVKIRCFDQKKLHVWYISVTALTGVSCYLQACNRAPWQSCWEIKDLRILCTELSHMGLCFGKFSMTYGRITVIIICGLTGPPSYMSITGRSLFSSMNPVSLLCMRAQF